MPRVAPPGILLPIGKTEAQGCAILSGYRAGVPSGNPVGKGDEDEDVDRFVLPFMTEWSDHGSCAAATDQRRGRTKDDKVRLLERGSPTTSPWLQLSVNNSRPSMPHQGRPLVTSQDNSSSSFSPRATSMQSKSTALRALLLSNRRCLSARTNCCLASSKKAIVRSETRKFHDGGGRGGEDLRDAPCVEDAADPYEVLLPCAVKRRRFAGLEPALLPTLALI